jgi:hypothetical protein
MLTHGGAQLSLWEREGAMATYLAFHEVDDVDHWLSSPGTKSYPSARITRVSGWTPSCFIASAADSVCMNS